MDIFSAAIGLLGLFICLIIFIPIILLIGVFLGYDQFTPITQSLVKSFLNLLRKVLNIPNPVKTQTATRINPNKKSTKRKSSKAESNSKPSNVDDAEFREIRS